MIPFNEVLHKLTSNNWATLLPSYVVAEMLTVGLVLDHTLRHCLEFVDLVMRLLLRSTTNQLLLCQWRDAQFGLHC